MATNKRVFMQRDHIKSAQSTENCAEKPRSRKAENDQHYRDCIHDKNDALETQGSVFYCTQCHWNGPITKTVIFTHGKLAAILSNRCFACGHECEK
jgi:hypothetical protein